MSYGLADEAAQLGARESEKRPLSEAEIDLRARLREDVRQGYNLSPACARALRDLERGHGIFCKVCSGGWRCSKDCPKCLERTCDECMEECDAGMLESILDDAGIEEPCRNIRCQMCIRRCKICGDSQCEECFPQCDKCRLEGGSCMGCSMHNLRPEMRCQDCMILHQQSSKYTMIMEHMQNVLAAGDPGWTIHTEGEAGLTAREDPELFLQSFVNKIRFNLAEFILANAPHSHFEGELPMPMGLHVVVLTFSRSPKEFREILMNAPELSECRQDLEAHGYAIELPSGAKIFVCAEVYGAVMEALRISGLSLCRKHVIVDPSLVKTVQGLVQALRSSLSVQPRGNGIIPLGLASHVVAPEPIIEVKSTFIQIKVPNSLASSSSDEGKPGSAPACLQKRCR